MLPWGNEEEEGPVFSKLRNNGVSIHLSKIYPPSELHTNLKQRVSEARSFISSPIATSSSNFNNQRTTSPTKDT